MDDEMKYMQSELQKIVLHKRDIKGKVLDIGGGGEGVIGLLYGEKAVVIDNRPEELAETDSEALKIVMDACELKFPCKSFEMATFFYSLMYMDGAAKAKAVHEASRVLKPGGILEIWDTQLPENGTDEICVYIANVSAKVNGRKIKTGYGVNIGGKHQTLESVCSLVKKSGLTVTESSIDKCSFHIIGVK